MKTDLVHREQLGSSEEYEAVKAYASKLGALVVGGKEERVVYVEYKQAENIRMFKGRWKMQQMGRAGGGGTIYK